MQRQFTARGIDILAGCLWVAAFVLWVWSTSMGDHESDTLGRLSILVGLLATSATAWGIATWMIYILRTEMRLGRLRDVSRQDDGREFG